MVIHDSIQLSKKIAAFILKSRNPLALFAGAGVSIRAGYPSWPDYLNSLAQAIEQYDSVTALYMKDRIKKGFLLQAASVFKSSSSVPKGELFRALSAPFINGGSPEKISDLYALPFRLVATTNYDTSLHRAYVRARGEYPGHAELDDRTLKEALWNTRFYIARIHGRAERPESIILSDEDYKSLDRAETFYIDYLKQLFTTCSCIFIGFSFLDPAINKVLEIIKERFGPSYPAFHLVLLSEGSDPTFAGKLAQFNFDTVFYQEKDNHRALWDSFELAAKELTKDRRPRPTPLSIPTDTIKKFLAASYTRIRLEKDIEPLKDMVVDGIILDFLNEKETRSSSVSELLAAIKKVFPLKEDVLSSITQKRIDRLSGRGWCRVEENIVVLTKNVPVLLGNDLDFLVIGLKNRLKVREGVSSGNGLDSLLKTLIEEILLARSWDLGAHYAGTIVDEVPNIYGTISLAVEGKKDSDIPFPIKEKVKRCLLDLFTRPDEAENKVLSELARTSYALNIVITSPSSSLVYQDILPDVVYLDSSFLMPAIVPAHTFKEIYTESIDILRLKSAQNRAPVRIVVAEDFLNEIVHHRMLALAEYDALDLNDNEELYNYISYNGAENVNVFLGGYANYYETIDKNISFAAYINRYAPYENEKELANYLNKHNIETINITPSSEAHKTIFTEVFIALQQAYKHDVTPDKTTKADILIEHEARQLFQLKIDILNGLKPIFVSADARLRRLTRNDKLQDASSVIISHKALIQLIDLSIGLKDSSYATTKLFWGTIAFDDDLVLRNYLVNQALRYQDEAMTLALTDVMENIVEETKKKAKEEKLPLIGKRELKEKVRRARFIDTVENNFYKNLADVINKKYPDAFNFAERAEENIGLRKLKIIADKIATLEDGLSRATDQDQKEKIRFELGELFLLRDKYKSLLTSLKKSSSK